ncbi:MAG: phosphonate ABC transporter ATP-binding protein [Nitrospinota bacterium]|nr:MAG: phosphonate ABC transporter ATP-binding protein [Nitrospinota bacterium]
MYELIAVRKVFPGNVIALDGITLTIAPGEQVAIIGPSGAGKTTLFRLLNCTLVPSEGELRIGGEEVRRLRGRRLRQVRRQIGTIYQQHNLVPRLRVIHNVLAGRLGAWSTLRSLWSLLKPLDVPDAYAALQQVGIPEKLYARTDELSGGQQQRVAIARVLLQDPAVILADEPVSSVDPALAEAIITLLQEICRTAPKTLIMNLHSVHLALAHFPRIIGLRAGKVLFDLNREAITDELLTTLYQGIETPQRAEQGDAGFRLPSRCGPLPV